MNQEIVKALFDYVDDGLYWKHSRGSNAKAGNRAGRLLGTGYHFLNRTTPPVRSAACAKGLEFREKLESAIRRSTFEIAFWCSQLLPGASARWLRFLYSRVQQAPMAHLLAQRYGLLNIHV